MRNGLGLGIGVSARKPVGGGDGPLTSPVVYDTNGEFFFHVPETANYLIEVWGAGGWGGSGTATEVKGGGGGGETSFANLTLELVEGDSHLVVVGASVFEGEAGPSAFWDKFQAQFLVSVSGGDRGRNGDDGGAGGVGGAVEVGDNPITGEDGDDGQDHAGGAGGGTGGGAGGGSEGNGVAGAAPGCGGGGGGPGGGLGAPGGHGRIRISWPAGD